MNGFKASHNLEISSLNQKLLYLDAYSRRENLNFMYIPEVAPEDIEEGEGIGDTREILWKFLEEKLHFEDLKSIEFQRVHRSGNKVSNKPRPILARFLRFTDREKVFRKARKLK